MKFPAVEPTPHVYHEPCHIDSARAQPSCPCCAVDHAASPSPIECGWSVQNPAADRFGKGCWVSCTAPAGSPQHASELQVGMYFQLDTGLVVLQAAQLQRAWRVYLGSRLRASLSAASQICVSHSSASLQCVGLRDELPSLKLFVRAKPAGSAAAHGTSRCAGAELQTGFCRLERC